MTDLYTRGVFINRTLYLVCALLLGMSFSCGWKDSSEDANNLGQLSLQELKCSSDDNIETKSYLEVERKLEEIDAFLMLYNDKVQKNASRVFRPILGVAKESTSPSSPMVTSEKLNLEKLEDISYLWVKAVGESNWFSFLSLKSNEFKLLEEVNVKEMKRTLKKLNRLVESVKRWNFNQCHLKELQNRKKRDIRVYLDYLKYSSDSCAVADHCTEEELKGAKKFFLSMCSSFNSETVCKQEYTQHAKQGSLSEFRSHYLEKSKGTYDNFFKIKVLNKWECTKNNSKKIINIPYFVDDIFGEKIGHDYERFESFVEYRWKSSNVKINLIKMEEASERSITVQWSKSNVSYVEYSRPRVINMSEELKYRSFMLTFAHELGHVLGFPDCYLEFFESSREEVIYYDLDFNKKNIMCQMLYKSKAPRSYLRQLIDNACIN